MVMIAKSRAAAKEEEESIHSHGSRSSTEMSSDMEKLDLTPGSSAMSSVFSSDNTSKRSSSPGRSPSRSNSGHGSGFFPSLHKRRTSSQGSVDRAKQTREDHLSRWLTTGNVIYKSVGLGLMDLVIGLEVVRLAREKGVGTHIENFS